jgi:hypothetical protein
VRRGLAGVLIAILTLAFPIEAVARPSSQPCCKRQVFLLLAREMSYEQALSIGWPYLGRDSVGIGVVTAADDAELSGLQAYEALGAGGGEPGELNGALLRAGSRAAAVGQIPLAAPVQSALLGSGQLGEGEAAARSSELIITQSPLDTFSAIPGSPAEEILLIVSVPVPSLEMRSRGDEAHPVIVLRGTPDQLSFREGPCLLAAGCARGVTSDTTRRDGIVSNVDVAPTILDFLGVPIPEEMTGSPIRIEGEPPTRLHQRYLQYQGIHTPVGLLALAVVLVTLFASVGVLVARRSAPPNAIKALGVLALVSVALPVVMLPSSVLPRLTYSVVLPVLAAAVGIVAIVAVRLGHGDPARPVAIVSGLGMGVVILDGVLGWPGMLMPLLGDSALEGVRFYGMGNAYAGVYMAGAILLSARIPPVAGMGLLLATGLLAGLPRFGAELGTSFTLFFAAGLWYLLRVRKGFGFREVATAGAITLAGLATILVIHRFSGVPTHVTRVLEDAERSGAGELLSVFGRRLSLNIRSTSATPVAWLIVALLPVWLAVAWNRLGPFGPSLRKDPSWREAAIVLALSSIVAFLVNDSIGVTGLGFTFLSAALIYPALRERWTISG